eukprot:gb/GECH01005707.1/.p1 GENE.gb/GECH01005707.1/~~gb/GECH01005707.1/.p1  ORF type:complete len:187 (+),score=49.02 gb/GECH01005707.1/:1-561(+)
MESRYFTRNEVFQHNNEWDCWVIVYDKVFDLTNLIQQYSDNIEVQPFLKRAGGDISHWFNSNLEIKTKRNENGEETPPEGWFLKGYNENQTPWWLNNDYVIGKITKKSRVIQILNTLTQQKHKLEVCSEDTLQQILNRYFEYNSHAASYTWKMLGKQLNLGMELFLGSNNLEKEPVLFLKEAPVLT